MKKTFALGVSAAGAALVALLAWSAAETFLAKDSPHALAARSLHTVIITERGKPATSTLVLSRQCGLAPGCRNGAGGIDVVVLEEGALPSRPTSAVVLTDTRCMPDRFGISHCLNKLRLADGAVLTVRHDHDMRRFACLRPGETVRIMSAYDAGSRRPAPG